MTKHRQTARLLAPLLLAGCSVLFPNRGTVNRADAEASALDGQLGELGAGKDAQTAGSDAAIDVPTCDLAACQPAIAPCTVAICTPSGGCGTGPAPDGTPCEDGAACTATHFCQAGACQAGGPLDFHVLFGNGNGARLSAVAPLADGGFLAAGSTDFAPGSGYDLWLIRTDATGKALWKKPVGSPQEDAASSITALDAGHFVVAGGSAQNDPKFGDGWLLGVDLAGNVAWQQTFGGTGYDRFATVATLANGHVAAGGARDQYNKNSTGWIVTTEANGTPSWQWQLTIPQRMVAVTKLAPQTDGTLGAIGYTRNLASNGADLYDIWVHKFDAAGKVLWKADLLTQITGDAAGVVAMGDGGFVAAADVSVASAPIVRVDRLDATGKPVWTQQLPSGAIETASMLMAGSNGEVLVLRTEHVFATSTVTVTVVRLDASGKVLATQTIPGIAALRPRPFAAVWLGGGSFVVAGDVMLQASGSSWTTYRASLQRLALFDAPVCAGEVACLGDTHGCPGGDACHVAYCDGDLGCKVVKLGFGACAGQP